MGTSARGTTPAGASVPVPAFAGSRAPVSDTTGANDIIAALLDKFKPVGLLLSPSWARHCRARYCIVVRPLGKVQQRLWLDIPLIEVALM
jgi:hypothetical protein